MVSYIYIICFTSSWLILPAFSCDFKKFSKVTFLPTIGLFLNAKYELYAALALSVIDVGVVSFVCVSPVKLYPLICQDGEPCKISHIVLTIVKLLI